MTNDVIPATQHAIQLVGPGVLRHNPAKPVPRPGPHQILARVEAVGLCFSDLKLLKQFSRHARKGEILRGLERRILEEIPSYVPEEKPTVPGHEVVCRIVAVGEEVQHHRIGERCLVQTDYRELQTHASNAAFGYNFEGGLQEYVLMDERVVIDPSSGERFLVSVDENSSASAVALVEPWACVENSYANPERRRILPGGRLLVVVEQGHDAAGLADAMAGGMPASITAVLRAGTKKKELLSLDARVEQSQEPADLADESFDDIVYFGARKEAIELLNDKLATGGIINIVTGGRRIGTPASVDIGRVHYGRTRWIGSHGASAADSYSVIPANGEIRAGEQIAVIGAAGPMGQMHVIRALCLEREGISVTAADVDDLRLEALIKKAGHLAAKHGIPLRTLNTAREFMDGTFSYFVVLVPAGSIVADAISRSRDGCVINIFAGIPAATRHKLDLDTYIANHCFMLGTSGSVLRDMRAVLRRLQRGALDTNCSVDAVSGIAGAMAGLAAVENRTLAGKVVVYPALHDVGLVTLAELEDRFPGVHAKLDRGQWTKAAEEELIREAGRRQRTVSD